MKNDVRVRVLADAVIDEEHGFRQSVVFADGGLFVSRTEPLEPARAGLVVCTGIFNDLHRNSRRDVLLARRLARDGFCTLRFHYSGTGNSRGDRDALCLTTMREDVRRALGLLTDAVGDVPLAFLGARLGAFVAASLTERAPGAPLVLWDPIPVGAMFVREATRAMRMQRIVAPEEGSSTGSSEPEGSAEEFEVVGYRFSTRLQREVEDASLVEILAGGTGPIFFANLAAPRRVAPGRALAQQLESAGRPVRYESFPEDDMPWFADVLADQGDDLGERVWPLIRETTSWLVDVARGSLR